MRVINPRQFKPANARRRLPKWARIALIASGAVLSVCVLINLVMLAMYRNKVLPNYSIGTVSIGSIPFDALDDRISATQLLPSKITLTKDDVTKQVAPQSLGVSVDWPATQAHIKESKTLFPALSLVFKRSVPLELKIDTTRFTAASKDIENTFTKAPLPERIAFQNDNFAIVAPVPGYAPKVEVLRQDILSTLEHGHTALTVPTTITNATEPLGKLGGELSTLQKQLDAKISLVSGGTTKQLSRADIAGFYESSGQTLKLSDAKMAAVIATVAKGLGVTAVNQDEAVQASHYAINKKQTVTFQLVGQGKTVHRYCTAVKGVSTNNLSEFRQKIAAVYGDPRGWNKGGQLALVYAASDCDYTVWLTAPAFMTSFSADICDGYYSCRVGNNVVINYDRWMGATDPWNASGGSLEDYRVMVINHETGHWFGFAHRNCTGPGQPAPVMQQQSIDLQGCTFNPWPTAAELAAL